MVDVADPARRDRRPAGARASARTSRGGTAIAVPDADAVDGRAGRRVHDRPAVAPPRRPTPRRATSPPRRADPDSVLACYRRLLAARREQPALQDGALELVARRRPRRPRLSPRGSGGRGRSSSRSTSRRGAAVRVPAPDAAAAGARWPAPIATRRRRIAARPAHGSGRSRAWSSSPSADAAAEPGIGPIGPDRPLLP